MSEVIDLYDGANVDTINRLSRCLWPHVIEFLQGIHPDDVFMDFGCGAGRYAEHVKDNLGQHIYCIDASESMLEVTKMHVPSANVAKFDMRNDDYSQIVEYSVGICIAVIPHFTNPCERKYAVSGMLSRLKPGGKLLIAVWDFAKVSPSKFINCDKSHPGDYQILLEDKPWYYHLYSQQTFIDFIAELINPNIHIVDFSTSKYNIYCTIRRIAGAATRASPWTQL